MLKRFNFKQVTKQCNDRWAVVVAQLAERSLPTPEIRRSNPVVGVVCQLYFNIEKTKINEKEAGNSPLKQASKKGR